MTLRQWMTSTVSTKAPPAVSGGKVGDPVTYLSNLLITPIMPLDLQGQVYVRQSLGIEGSAAKFYEFYTQSHQHVKSGGTVTEIPNIKEGHQVIDGSATYTVRYVEEFPAGWSTAAYLACYAEKSIKA